MDMDMEKIRRNSTKSLVVSPISNINLRTRRIIDQGLLDELPIDKGDKLSVFNLLTQSIEHVEVSNLNTNHHWYYLDNELFKVIHILD